MRSLGHRLPRLLIKLRHLLLIVVIGGAAVAMVMLPSVHPTEGTSLNALAPRQSSALASEAISARKFAFPILTRTMVVVRDPHGLPAARQLRLLQICKQVTRGQLPGLHGIAAAIPVSNTLRIPAFSREHGTTTVIYLYYRSSVGAARRYALANRLVRQVIGHRQGEFEGVTGETAGALAQNQIIDSRLGLVELATILLLAVAIAIHFRAPGAAVLTVIAVAVAYILADRAVAEFGALTGAALPAQIRPLLVVLVFGVTTDYSMFFLSRFQALLRSGQDRRDAGAQVLREIAPIVAVAGLTVAVGTAGLLAASLVFLREFGPGLAIAVLSAMLVSVLVVPAALAVAGGVVFWPHSEAVAARSERPDTPRGPSAWAVRSSVRHPLVATVLVLAGVAAAATGLARIAVGNELIRGLPSSSGPARAFDQARKGFAPGFLAPAVVVVTGPSVGRETTALTRLQHEIEQQREVALVVGPGQMPLARRLGFVVAHSGDAARYLVFLSSDPLGSRAIGAVRELVAGLPQMLRAAHVQQAHASVAGDTAISAEVVDGTISSLARVLPVVLCLIFIVIALYLRALVAPFYLMLTSVLAVVATIGLTVYGLQDLAGYGQTTYYTLFTVAVLLISLGSDYNVFVVGRIWQEGRRRLLPEAVEIAGARAARPITTAGLVLAASFALLAIVPLRGFREIACAMALGLIIDAFVVRTVLVPALLSLFGRLSGWPGHALKQTSE